MVLSIKNFANFSKAFKVEGSSKYRPINFLKIMIKSKILVGTFSQKEILCIFLKKR